MINDDLSITICQKDPQAAARMLCESSQSVDKLTKEVAELRAENTRLRSEIEALRKDLKKQTDKTAKDSHNSSKPPSSDGLKKPKPKSLRKPSDRPSGGQPGHKGQTLKMVEKPDFTVTHAVECCAGCGCSLTEQAPDRIERRQVFELPEPKVEVTEHQAEVKTCVCGCLNHAGFPPEAVAPVQYGPRLKAVAVYFKEYQLLPFERLTEIMRDIFGCGTFSQGTLANFTASYSQQLEPIDEAIKAAVAQSKVVNFDETGMRAVGSLHWLHTISTDLFTWFFAHKKRGLDAMKAAGVLPMFEGCAVHDFWRSYLKFDCAHAFCNAHLLRELTFQWEEEKQAWAKSMIDHLLAIKTAVDLASSQGHEALSNMDLQDFQKRYLDIVAEGYANNPEVILPNEPPRRGRKKQSKTLNLLDRFRDYPWGILAFMYDFRVPFDNNLAERDLRMMKLRQKISGTFRNFEALVSFCRIRSYVSTARKNGMNALLALHGVFTGNPFMPEITMA